VDLGGRTCGIPPFVVVVEPGPLDVSFSRGSTTDRSPSEECPPVSRSLTLSAGRYSLSPDYTLRGFSCSCKPGELEASPSDGLDFLPRSCDDITAALVQALAE
jgi:hypothetical protein